MEQLRRGAGEAPEAPAFAADGGYSFEDTTLYETHRGILRFFRRLLNPILKLFFNPTPLVHALNTQARINKEAAAREAERDRRQAEWNALHYDILQRVVTEVSRVSIEMQNVALRVEALGAKVDFNERRVRGIENVAQQGRPARGGELRGDQRSDARPGDLRGDARSQEPRGTEGREGREPREPREARPEARNGEAATVVASAAVEQPAGAPAAPEGTAPADGARRKRRRRRGRRSGSGLAESGSLTAGDQSTANGDAEEPEGADGNGEADVAEGAEDPGATAESLPDSFATSAQETAGDAGAPAPPHGGTDPSPDTAFTAGAEPQSPGFGEAPPERETTPVSTTPATEVSPPPSHMAEYHQAEPSAPAAATEQPHPSLPSDDPGTSATPASPDPAPQDR
jgi:hypothetical protein